MRGLTGATAKLGSVALLLALAAGFLGPWAWPLELFANFRVQYAALLLLCAVTLLILREFKWAIIAALAAAATTASVFAYVGWSHASPSPTDPTTSFRLVTFNVWFRNRDLRPVASYLDASGADAVVLLELDLFRAMRLQKLLTAFPFAQIGFEGHGAVIFSRWPILEHQFTPLCEQCVSATRVRLDWRGRPIDVVGAHLHWPLGPEVARLRAAELQGLARLVRARTLPTLLGGDFNLTPWSRYFARFVADSGLMDCAQRQGWRPTWPRATAVVGIRIDHCFASAEWRPARVSVGPQLGSDHHPNVVDLTLPSADAAGQRGRYAELGSDSNRKRAD